MPLHNYLFFTTLREDPFKLDYDGKPFTRDLLRSDFNIPFRWVYSEFRLFRVARIFPPSKCFPIRTKSRKIVVDRIHDYVYRAGYVDQLEVVPLVRKILNHKIWDNWEYVFFSLSKKRLQHELCAVHKQDVPTVSGLQCRRRVQTMARLLGGIRIVFIFSKYFEFLIPNDFGISLGIWFIVSPTRSRTKPSMRYSRFQWIARCGM